MCSASTGVSNAPGTANDDNWSQRLDRPLHEYLKDPVMGPKFQFLHDEIVKGQRLPKA